MLSSILGYDWQKAGDQMNDNDHIPSEMFEHVGADAVAEPILRPHVTYIEDAWRRLKQNKLSMFGLVLLVFLSVMVIIGPWISPYSHETVNPSIKNQWFSREHWFGTDALGRDYFARVWQGGRVSILIGLSGAFISAIIGCLYGGVSAYFGGRVDTIMMRIVEILNSVPYLLVVILLSLALDSKGIGTLLLAMTLTGWSSVARLVRAQMLQIRSSDFVLAARLLGTSPLGIITRHLIPNTLSVIIVAVTFRIPSYIFGEAFLSYVGLGVQAPNTSWGALCSQAQLGLRFNPHLMFLPACMIAMTMLAFTLLGDGLRDALDPRLRR